MTSASDKQWETCYSYLITDDAKLALFKDLKAKGELTVLRKLFERWIAEPMK